MRSISGYEFLRFQRVEHEGRGRDFAREIVDFIFQVANPAGKFFAFCGRDAGGLVREVGANVAIDQDDLPSARADSILLLASKRSPA